MQRDGGPGGGGPVGAGNSFTGAAQTLEFMGAGVWAGWSGEQTLPVETDVTLFEFLSPLKSLMGKFGFAGNIVNGGASNDFQIKITYDNIVVFNLAQSGVIDRPGNMGPFPTPRMIIPSGTNVKVIMQQSEDVVMTGTAWITAWELRLRG